MAGHAEDLWQANVAKLLFISGDKTDVFMCKQWISWVQSFIGLDQHPHHDLRPQHLEGSTFAFTRSINHSSTIDINNWDSFKTGLLDTFLVVWTSRTTTVNITTLIMGQNEGVINYYICVVDTIKDMEALKKLHQEVI